MILTVNQLEEAAPYLDYRRLELILPNFNATCKKFEINNPYRVAHFLTQILVESNFFRFIQEPGNGLEYEGVAGLGNTERGDGRRYMGRGYLRLIGRRGYQEYKNFSKIDVINYPHYVTTPKVAMDIAGWLWSRLRLNEAADHDQLMAITLSLKGGYIQIREREDMLKRVKKAMGIQ